MTTVFRSTTALAVILSLGLPTLAQAQQPLIIDGKPVTAPPEDAAPEAAATSPEALAAKLAKKAGGEAEKAEQQAEKAAEKAQKALEAKPEAPTEPAPAADKGAAKTAPDAAQDQSSPRQPADQQPAEKTAPDQAGADTAPADQPADDPATDSASAPAQQPPAPEKTADPAPQPKAPKADAGKDSPQPKAEKPAPTADAQGAGNADQPAAQGTPTPDAAPAAAPDDSADRAGQETATPAASAPDSAAPDIPTPDSAAKDVPAKDVPAKDSAAKDSATKQDTAPTEAELRDALKKAVTGQDVTPQPAPANDGSVTDTPEASAAPTAAAEEAAKGADPAAAAALAAVTAAQDGTSAQTGTDPKVTTETVTKDSARSSSEEFDTSLRDALAKATTGAVAPAADKKDDKKDDLAKAALIGLGALAVGHMMSNQRQVTMNTGDRVIVTRPDGSQEVIKDDMALLRQPGASVTTETFDDGSTRTIVQREDGSQVVTIRDADLRVLRRTLVAADGTSTQLIDDTARVAPVTVGDLPPAARPQPVSISDEAALREALRREAAIDRRFSLGQIRNIAQVRALVAPVDIDAITFDTASAAISPDQARQLSTLGKVISDAIRENPQELFLIEGYTDAVGDAGYNLALSDRRAETVALALSEYFAVPPENMVVQGYGEQFLKVRTDADERRNRRVAVRRITDLVARD
ncbi:OmpA family protein [Paracoccus jiaweipingae]|uniref:OmpA family protein n=1 Tax=unclassified Paracoccus (in: a-proteobacteria) TaxID=2688777 RepID=UPI00379CF6E9